jgi:hypothetical protein
LRETREGTLSPDNLSTKRQWIADLARKNPERALTSLHHLIDLEWMFEAFRLTRKDGAPGIDGVTAEDYEANLEVNLTDLLARIKSGRYVAPPVRRHYIPKADGTQRPLGIPTLEDKVAQRGSCPLAWCSFGGVITALAGMGRVGQAATAGSPTMGSSLRGAIVSSVM